MIVMIVGMVVAVVVILGAEIVGAMAVMDVAK